MDQLTAPNPVAAARALGPLIQQHADTIEQTRRVPAPLVAALHKSRLFRMHLPRSVGGDQVDPSQYLLAVEEVSRHDASLGWMLFVANSTALIAPYLDLEVARTVFGAPDSVVAWGPPNACRTQAVDGGYIVNGRWDFASGCRLATSMGAHTLVVEPDGKLRLNQFGKPAIRSFLFAAEGCGVTRHLGYDRSARHGVRLLFRQEPVRAGGLFEHARGSLVAARARPALCVHATGALCRRRGRCRSRHRPRHVGRPDRVGREEDAARTGAHGRQPDRAGRHRRDRKRGSARRAPMSSRRSPTFTHTPTRWSRWASRIARGCG